MKALRLRDDVRISDEAVVRRLVAATGFFRDDEVEVAVELVRERRARGAASGYEFLFAEEVGDEGHATVVGYACFGPIPCTLHSWDLYWIVTDPQRQRRGIGRRLLRACEAEMARLGGERIYVDTSSRASYDPTRRFYEANGYRVAAHLPDFYAPGDGKVVYVKEAGTARGGS